MNPKNSILRYFDNDVQLRLKKYHKSICWLDNWHFKGGEKISIISIVSLKILKKYAIFVHIKD
jgi:hypothetical protein